MFHIALLALCADISHATPTVTVSSVQMTAKFAQTRPWTVRVSGQCGTNCKTVHRMQTATCNDHLFVAWTAHKGWVKNIQYPDQNLYDETSVGHLAEYTVDASTSQAVLVSDQVFPLCNEMGGVTVTADCALVGVLCRSSSEAGAFGATSDFVGSPGAWTNGDNFGWYSTSQDDPTQPKYRMVDQMYLMEWDTGNIANAPSAKVLVSHSIGGWNYGNFALAVNKDKTVYSIDLKTTITSDGDPNWHEGSTQFAINRGDFSWNQQLSQGWACGVGHVQGNRLTYNSALNKWGRYCWTDGCYADGKPAGMTGCYGTFFGTIPKSGTEGPAQLIFLPPGESVWTWNGGPTNMVSRGSKGFLAVALQPDTSGNKLTLGVSALPTDQEFCYNGSSSCNFAWLSANTLGGVNQYPRAGSPEVGPLGFANIQHIGAGGEEGDRFLIGFAENVQFQGKASSYHVVEVDAAGQIYGEIMVLNKTGWGEEDAWAGMANGCVAFPFAWTGDTGPGAEYGAPNTEDKLTDVMRITVVCPEATQPDLTNTQPGGLENSDDATSNNVLLGSLVMMALVSNFAVQ